MTPFKGKLAIITSFYSYQAYAPYVLSLAQTLGVLSKLGIAWDYVARPSDFHVERAINNTLTELMERGDFTDALLIDSDESWRPEDVVRLLMHEEEVVAGSYRMKNNPKEYVGSVEWDGDAPLGRMLADGTALLKATRVAAGFLRVRFSALRRFAQAYPELRSQEPDGEKVQFFQRAPLKQADGSCVMGCQDMVFSQRCLDAGIGLWIDPTVQVDHWWIENHHGDFDKFLRARSELSKAADAFKVVQGMAAELRERAA